ncbi:branched chain amino acid aminotransferase [bacterium]|nr:MAG: branched chain amino acid aminotransferase [bacterium]
MPFPGCKKIWLDGEFVDFEDAKIHLLSHVIHYGTGVFEGERCYNTEKGAAVFRLKDHSQRLLNSARIYRMTSECNPPDGKGGRMFPDDMFIDYTVADINEASLATIRENELDNCYIRPLVFRGDEALGVNPFTCKPHVMIAVWEWGKYLGPEALEKGVDVQVSTWTRMAPNTFPAMAKSCANYMNSQLVKMEAIINGFVEGIACDVYGYVSEGSGENLFLVKDGRLLTPPLGASVLPGITRNSVITIAEDMGIQVVEQLIPREMLYLADEVFFTGSAAEITPIASVDHIPVGKGSRGEITKALQERFFDIVEARVEDKYGWLTFVY